MTVSASVLGRSRNRTSMAAADSMATEPPAAWVGIMTWAASPTTRARPRVNVLIAGR